ncbi:MAG: PTS mannose/fructose/sorbose transporter subunit IIB [Sphingobacteriales bacterium 50-39]|nr:PTS sugar transporter subunit IIB [Sphingobacteriales bacterium]OJW58243.1 MAG: PTS mannose/fructose/sorbose transporter subunit IIB [Sphingobacteriales bacterium 50-39]
MVKLTRIDDRLVHGQVAFTWVPALGIDCLIVANDRVAKDEFLKTTLNLARPAGIKFFIRAINDAIALINDPKSQPFHILLIAESVKDAHALVSGIPEIRSVNFGGIRSSAGSRLVSKAIALTEEDIARIRDMLTKGIELEARQVPTDSKLSVESLIQ